MIDAMFLMEEPQYNQSQQRFKDQTFRALGTYGWTVKESDEAYTLIYLNNYHWVIPKKKGK
jgi:hypothetical protein